LAANEVFFVREFLDVVTVDTALERIKKVFTHTDIEWVPLSESHNRTLADSISSPELLPAFTRSTVDGYAIRAQDSFGSSESLPAFLTLTGEVIMGRSSEFYYHQENVPGFRPEECCRGIVMQ